MNKTENPRKALGKGLNVLLAARTQAPPMPLPPSAATADGRANDHCGDRFRSTRTRFSPDAVFSRIALLNWRNPFAPTALCSPWLSGRREPGTS